jgi:hypothetical protein
VSVCVCGARQRSELKLTEHNRIYETGQTEDVLEHFTQQKVAETGFHEVLVEQWDDTVCLGVAVAQGCRTKEVVDRWIDVGIVACEPRKGVSASLRGRHKRDALMSVRRIQCGPL